MPAPPAKAGIFSTSLGSAPFWWALYTVSLPFLLNRPIVPLRIFPAAPFRNPSVYGSRTSSLLKIGCFFQQQIIDSWLRCQKFNEATFLLV